MRRKTVPGSKRRPGAPPLLADPPRTDEFALRAYGVRIGIRTDDPYVLDRIRAYLPPGWKPVESSRVERLYVVRRGASSSTYILYADARQMLQTESLEQLLSNLALDLHFYIAERARDHLFIHAGVVGWGGRAIVIPGRSSSGKTTLVRALLHCGATYYSDEYAVFDRHGCVHPFPTPLFFRREGEEGEPMLIETLGSSVGTVPLPVGLIVFTAYDPTCQWRPRRLSPGEALLDLLSHTISARRHPAFALAVLSRVASRAIALKGKRGEAEPTAQEILSRAVL